MDRTTENIIRRLWTGSETFRGMYRALKQAPASKVDIQVRVATAADHTQMMNDGISDGMAIQYGFSPRGLVAIDMRAGTRQLRGEKGVSDEEVMAEEIVHMAALFAKGAKTGVAEACKADALPCANEMTDKIMREFNASVAAAQRKPK